MASPLILPRIVGVDDTEAPIRAFAEVLAQYDSRFSLEYVPEFDRVNASPEEVTHPFRIVEHTARHGRQVIRTLSAAEMRRPDLILAWLFEGDLAKHRPVDVLKRIELQETAARMLELRAKQDDAAARVEFGAWLVEGGRERKNRVQLGRNKYVS